MKAVFLANIQGGAFQEASYHAKRLLVLIHANVYGPIMPSLFGKHHYFLTFIDDCIRKTEVHFLKEKSKVFGVVKKFKIYIENQSGCSIKAIRSDRDSEFTSKAFEDFGEEHGLWHPLTALNFFQ